MTDTTDIIKTEKKGKAIKKTPWSESVSELYRPSDCRLSAKLVPTIPRLYSQISDPWQFYKQFMLEVYNNGDHKASDV
jgi:hypothetical protein